MVRIKNIHFSDIIGVAKRTQTAVTVVSHERIYMRNQFRRHVNDYSVNKFILFSQISYEMNLKVLKVLYIEKVMTYTLKSVKAIEFYKKNPALDFDNVNELFVDLIQNITNTIQDSISVNEVKALLHKIHANVNNVQTTLGHNNKMIQMTYDYIGEQKSFYVDQMKDILQNRKQGSDILSLIRETNNAFLDKATYTLLQQFPKLTTEVKLIQKEVLQESQTMLTRIYQQGSQGNIEPILQQQYQVMSDKMLHMLQSVFSQDSVFYQNNMEMKSFLEKQKNSTRKGKESEEKLKSVLNHAYPQGTIIDKSGEGKACDYLLERADKCPILFENKDYQTNVPNEEIKKFIRDIEYQSKHGIMISQHSGIQYKEDYQIDIHMDQIMVYVHYGHYDETKVKMAVNLVDHLDKMMKQHHDETGNKTISMEQLSAINKEYLHFIGQKKQLIETCKKQHKEQLKQLEDIEMPQLTIYLNSVFTNVDQLSFTCNICNQFNAKNKRALITHQNKCKKKYAQAASDDDVMNLTESYCHSLVE